jgi:hypothetical protein
MLIEMWERFRGYDKWIPAEATVETSRVSSYHDRSGDHETSRDVLKFIDAQGETQRLSFCVPGDSPLYQLVDGSKIDIRYNPSNPDEYYLRELLQTRVHAVVKRFSVALFMLVFLFLSGWLKSLGKR